MNNRDEFWELYKCYFHQKVVEGDLRICLYGQLPVIYKGKKNIIGKWRYSKLLNIVRGKQHIIFWFPLSPWPLAGHGSNVILSLAGLCIACEISCVYVVFLFQRYRHSRTCKEFCPQACFEKQGLSPVSCLMLVLI